MNRLPPAGDGRWRLPRHAHVVVYEAGRFRGGEDDDRDEAVGAGDAGRTDEGDGSAGRGRVERSGSDAGVTADGPDELLTIYDCGAAQKPPSAQLIGHLVHVRADVDVDRTETGYVVRMREPSVLEEQGERRWVIAER